jgi:L-aspartate oxidase
VGEDDDPALHAEDTLRTGRGLCRPSAVEVLTEEAPARIRDLVELGVEFDEGLGLEGGHSRRRVVHAGGAATGDRVARMLAERVLAHPRIQVAEGERMLSIWRDDDRCVGVVTDHRAVAARATLLSTGGAAALWERTTNPAGAVGEGTAAAYRAGAALADLEFVQFHPTTLVDSSLLLSEALRGEGAILRDENGVAFMASEHPLGDLAPRDVVARAIARRIVDRGLSHVWLDARPIAGFEERFPTIWAACHTIGLDPSQDLLPVAPAAHYLSGGVCTDLDGATTLAGLWSCGESADSGVHGANRLASNSLLDGLVFGARCVDAIAAGRDGPEQTGLMRGIAPWSGLPDRADGSPTHHRAASREDLQQLMTREAGVLRDAASLSRALLALDAMEPRTPVVRNLWSVSRALVLSAIAREESRGTHTRLDYPETDEAFLGRFVFGADGLPSFVPLPAEVAVS